MPCPGATAPGINLLEATDLPSTMVVATSTTSSSEVNQRLLRTFSAPLPASYSTPTGQIAADLAMRMIAGAEPTTVTEHMTLVERDSL